MSEDTLQIYKAGLGLLGKHPLKQSLAFLELKINQKCLCHLEEIANYPLLVYFDASKNEIEDISPLSTCQCLTQLNLR